METNKIMMKVISGIAKDIATHPILFKPLIYWIFRFGSLYDLKFINRFVETELDLRRKNKIPDNYLRRMSQSQAKIAMSKLNNVDSDNAIRIENAHLYHKGLSDIQQIIIPA